MSDIIIHMMNQAYLETKPRPGNIHVTMDDAMRSAVKWLAENITEDMKNCFECASTDEMRQFLLKAAERGQ
jgi:hypothetical protein